MYDLYLQDFDAFAFLSMALRLLQRYTYLKNRRIVICLCKKPANYLDHNIFLPDTKGLTLFFNQPVPKKSGSRGEAMNTQSFDCGEGLEAQLRSDSLRRNGEHVLYVKGIDDYGNVGETISTRWIVGT